jgi:hypothetical protein
LCHTCQFIIRRELWECQQHLETNKKVIPKGESFQNIKLSVAAWCWGWSVNRMGLGNIGINKRRGWWWWWWWWWFPISCSKNVHVCKTTKTCKVGLLLLAHENEGYWHLKVAPFYWLADRCCDGKGWILV